MKSRKLRPSALTYGTLAGTHRIIMRHGLHRCCKMAKSSDMMPYQSHVTQKCTKRSISRVNSSCVPDTVWYPCHLRSRLMRILEMSKMPKDGMIRPWLASDSTSSASCWATAIAKVTCTPTDHLCIFIHPSTLSLHNGKIVKDFKHRGFVMNFLTPNQLVCSFR